MLSIIKNFPLTLSVDGDGSCVALEQLDRNLAREIKASLKELSKSPDDFLTAQARHLAIDNLSNVLSAVKATLMQKKLINTEVALTLIDEQTELTKNLLRHPVVAGSAPAAGVCVKTLNYLFGSKQRLKQKFLLTTPVELSEGVDTTYTASQESKRKTLTSAYPKASTMGISSTILYQMHHSLFPAERMLVASGQRTQQGVNINAVFEVTGVANQGHVRADADRLGRALISMTETDSYFALWIHSHPGDGVSMTGPSSTDLNQEEDWLRDYSPDLVNAIMVRDGYIRFWGQSLKNKQIAVSIDGPGVKRISETEDIYKLES